MRGPAGAGGRSVAVGPLPRWVTVDKFPAAELGPQPPLRTTILPFHYSPAHDRDAIYRCGAVYRCVRTDTTARDRLQRARRVWSYHEHHEFTCPRARRFLPDGPPAPRISAAIADTLRRRALVSSSYFPPPDRTLQAALVSCFISRPSRRPCDVRAVHASSTARLSMPDRKFLEDTSRSFPCFVLLFPFLILGAIHLLVGERVPPSTKGFISRVVPAAGARYSSSSSAH